MSVLSPFSASAQGRRQPTGIVAPIGDYVFVLGSEDGEVRSLGPGDFVEVHQTATVTGIRFIRIPAQVIFRAPPGDLSWRLQLVLDGGAASFDLPLTRSMDLPDLAIPIGALTGSHDVAVRLALFGTAGVYAVPLPAVYLDGVVLDTTSTGLGLINRDPAPDAVGVPVDSSISLDLIDLLGTNAVTPAGTQVYVSGILAYDAGVFQTGFDGPDSADDATIAGGFGLRITIDPTTLFTSEQLVEVRVVAAQVGGSIDQSWTFTAEDIAVPTLVSAFATDRKLVRVVFSEPVTAAQATDPENWTITVVSSSLDDGLPAVTLEVVSVTAETDTTFLLETDIEHTRGALYRVTVTGVEDVAGNAVTDPTNQALFIGYACAVPAGRSFELVELVPDMNVNEDDTQDLRRFLACLQEVVDLLLCDVDRWVEIFDVDRCNENFLDAILYDLGNPFSFVDLTVTDKRRLALVLVEIYKQKGTADGIINAIRFFLGIEVTLSYPAFDDIWILGVDELGEGSILGTDEPGPRYSYYIIAPVVLTEEQRILMRRLATYMHPAHEHLLDVLEPPEPPAIPDHWELSYSLLGVETLLH